LKKKLIKSENENTENQVTAAPEAAGTEKTEPEKTAAESRAEEKKETKRVKEQPEAIPSEASAPKAGLGWVKTALVIFLGVIMLLFMGMSFAGYKLSNRPYILPNVYANGVSLGGLSVEQAQQLLEQEGFDEAAEGRLRVKMPMGANFKLDYSEAGARLGSQAAAETAFEYGHSGNWFSDFFTYAGNIFAPVDIIYFDKTLNYEYINAAMDEAIARFNEKTADTGYELDLTRGRLTVLKGAGELQIDKEALYKLIVSGLLAERESVTYTLPEKNVSYPDFEKIAEEINVEAANADFDENFDIRPSVTGVHLNAAEAKQVWDGASLASIVTIPITITEPEISSDDLRDMLFRDMLGTHTTHFSGSSDNRINNIKLASDKLNGLILMPGDRFSFNGFIGQRTREAGFKPAGAYLNGYVVDEVGGGICQVSSTLYYVSMLAQMETVERTCHYFPVDYIPPGLDATVSWPDTDFKFENCREYPVMVVSKCDTKAKTITIEIWGTDTDGSYVELTYGVGTWFDEEYPEVAVGKTAVSYRVYYDKDGNKIKTERESYSAYHYHDWQIQWPEPEEDEEVPTEPEGGEGGEGGTEPTPTPTPTPDPEPGDNSGDNMEDEDGNINFG